MNRQTSVVPALDGYPLGVTQFSAERPRASLVIASATGVPQQFYRRFAEHFCAAGFDTFTLDYRGIGASRPKTLRGFSANFMDWSLDIAAILHHVRQWPRPIFYVGHSFGGHALGLLPNLEGLSGAYTFATGTGWHGWMTRSESLKVRFFWSVLGPALLSIFGSLRWDLLKMGEALPRGVFEQWRRWCSFPHYFFDDPQMPQAKERFHRIYFPMVAATSVDDPWAPPRSRDAFLVGHPSLYVQAIDLNPSDIGQSSIGHMGYFRAQAKPIWEQTSQWFEEILKASPKATATEVSE